MRRGAKKPVFSRPLLIASVLLTLFVLCDIALFSWLIFRSLSKREVDRVLLQAQSEARDLAELIEERTDVPNVDLYLVMAFQREVQNRINSDLITQEFVRTVAIYDDQGKLVYSKSDSESVGSDEFPTLGELVDPDGPLEQGSVELPPVELPDGPALESGDADDPIYQISEEIGDLGTVRILLSQTELERRTESLRQDLVNRTLWIAAVSLAILITAYVIIWILLRRSRRLEEQAAEADRLAYLGTLAAGLAHEIRNPLNSLNLNMQMLAEELGVNGDQPIEKRLVGITRDEITRLEGLVTDFLSYARPRPLELQEVEPAELLRRLTDVLEGELRARGAEVEVVDRALGGRVKVDPKQINQLLLNLTQNALNATEETNRPPRITLSAEVRGDRIALSVEDNGVGISSDEQTKIFDIFYSTRKGGTGLGLAVVDRIAKDHGGRLELGSVPGQGTKISVLLPGHGLPQRSLTGQFPLIQRGESRG